MPQGIGGGTTTRAGTSNDGARDEPREGDGVGPAVSNNNDSTAISGTTANDPATSQSGSNAGSLKAKFKKGVITVVAANQFTVPTVKKTLKFSNGDRYEGDFDLTHAR